MNQDAAIEPCKDFGQHVQNTVRTDIHYRRLG